MFQHEVVSTRNCDIMVVTDQTNLCSYVWVWGASDHAFLYIYIRILCLVSGTHVLVHLILRVLSTYKLVHRCVCMVSCATSWIRVLCACSTTARNTDAILCVFIARVQMCVVNSCCCNVSVAKYIVHLALPLETSIGHLLVERATDSASVICDWLRHLSV